MNTLCKLPLVDRAFAHHNVRYVDSFQLLAHPTMMITTHCSPPAFIIAG
jgi:hypothetical protein